MASQENLDESKNLTLTDHLSELRVRLIHSLLALLVMTGICYAFSPELFEIIRQPIEPFLPTGGLIYTGPMDKFMAHLKLSIVCGVILSCPFWLYQVWKFVAPGLYQKERRYGIGFIFSGSILFVVGVSFAYFIVLPKAFEFLFSYGGTKDTPMISIAEYLSFLSQMCLMFGVAFELPLIIVLLGMLGIVNHKFLREKRRFAVMILALAAAILTPPDILSMSMMLVPLLALYEISILLVIFFEKKRGKDANEATDG